MSSLRDSWNFMLGAAVGAALTAIYDPVCGARRRSWLRDKAMRGGNIARNEGRKQLKNAVKHLRGAVAEFRANLRGRSATVDDQQLLDRVRAQLGHVLSHSSFDVEARDGRVIVQGVVLPGERQKIEERLSETRGVREFEVRVEERERDSVPSSQLTLAGSTPTNVA